MKNEMKARGTLLMTLPNKDQLKFHSYQDAKLLMEAIEKRYGGNKESKKVQKTLLKQKYENFAASSSETLDQTFDSQLNSPQLTREDLEQIDLDDLKEMDLHWEMAMLTIRAIRFIKRTGMNLDMNGQRIGFDRSKEECFNCHKHGHFTRECKAPKNQEYRGREYDRKTVPMENTTENALIAQDGIRGSDSEKLEKAEKERDELKLTLEKFQNSSKSLNNLLESQVCDKFKTGLGYNAVSPEVESFVKTYNMLKNQEDEKSRLDKGYHAVPSLYTGNFIPPKPDLMFIDEQVKSEFVDVVSNVASSEVNTVESKQETADKGVVKTNTVRKNSFGPPIIEDWNFEDESEVGFTPNKTVRHSIKKIKFVKSARETIEKIESPKQNKHHPRGNQRNWNNLMSQRLGSDFKMINKACYVCGSFEHLHYVCDKKVVRPVWNNLSRVNHKNFANKLTHPHPKREFVPQAVLTRPGKINTAGASVNTVVRQVNTTDSITTMNHPRLISNAFKRGHSHNKRSFNRYSANKNSIFNKKVNTVSKNDSTARHKAVVNENIGKGVNADNPQQKEYKEKGVIDSGCSRHMTGNKCYLTEYKDYDGGFVSFGDGKGRISSKGKIKTGTLDFDDVYFCKELKYNLFSVSQMCDKKNNVLFTNTECLVLSYNFKLLDESQVLLRVIRKDKIYSVDLYGVVPTRGLSCLFAKAIIDEYNLWHRRLGYINYKTMNKLVRGNLVRGLPSKVFENDHSCVAC
ncbi:ribonuclease H-like domain-containing protein [Tanacetum coccineum]